MVKPSLAIFTLVLAASLPAQAVLAPNYQRLVELKAILAESAVIDSFDVYHPIDRIEFIKQDFYRVAAGSCHVDVTLVDKPANEHMVGPRQFTIKVGKKICS
jgi:hypothetical protein